MLEAVEDRAVRVAMNQLASDYNAWYNAYSAVLQAAPKAEKKAVYEVIKAFALDITQSRADLKALVPDSSLYTRLIANVQEMSEQGTMFLAPDGTKWDDGEGLEAKVGSQTLNEALFDPEVGNSVIPAGEEMSLCGESALTDGYGDVFAGMLVTADAGDDGDFPPF